MYDVFGFRYGDRVYKYRTVPGHGIQGRRYEPIIAASFPVTAIATILSRLE